MRFRELVREHFGDFVSRVNAQVRGNHRPDLRGPVKLRVTRRARFFEQDVFSEVSDSAGPFAHSRARKA